MGKGAAFKRAYEADQRGQRVDVPVGTMDMPEQLPGSAMPPASIIQQAQPTQQTQQQTSGKGAAFKRQYEAEQKAKQAELDTSKESIIQNDPLTLTNGPVDTRTSEPPKKPFADYEGAGFGTEFKAGFVDDPDAKIAIYAKARFPEMDEEERRARYGIKDGEIVFIDDDGSLKREMPDNFTAKAKRSLAGVAASSPAIAGGGIGTMVAGPLGAAAGAAIGEAGRKAIGGLALGDNQDVLDYAGDMAVEGAMAGVGDIIGRAIAGTVNAKRFAKGGGLKYGMKKEIRRGYISPADQTKAEMIQQLADDAGIKLAPHQLYDKQSMTDTWRYLRKDPRTSDLIQEFEKAQADQTERAIYDKFGSMIGPDDTPNRIGTDLKESAEKAIQTEIDKRGTTTNPLYRNAFRNVDQSKLDLSPVISDIDNAITKFGDDAPTQKVLNRLKKRLTVDSTLPDGTKTRVPDTNLERINNTKMEIDDLISGASKEAGEISPSSKNVLNGYLNKIKTNLLKIADEASPDYAVARAKFAEMSEPIDNLRKGIIGELSNLQKDSTISKATNKLFNPTTMPDARLMKYAKAKLDAQDPTIFKRAVGGYIRDSWSLMKESEQGNILNAAGKMRKKLFGSPAQRDLLKAALDPAEYKNLEDLMEVFRRVSIGKSGASDTASFQEVRKNLDAQMASIALRTAEKAKNPVNNIIGGVLEYWNEIFRNKYSKDLFEALTQPDVTAQIRRMKLLEPGTKKMIRALSTVTTLIATDMGVSAFETRTRKDETPELLKDQSQSQ